MLDRTIECECGNTFNTSDLSYDGYDNVCAAGDEYCSCCGLKEYHNCPKCGYVHVIDEYD